MTISRLVFFCIIAMLLSSFCASAQKTCRLTSDCWRGLILDQTSSADAIRILGGRFDVYENRATDVYPLNKILAIEEYPKAKGFRLMVKVYGGGSGVFLIFKDDRLVCIQLAIQNEQHGHSFKPDSLRGLFGTELTPKFSAIEGDFHPGSSEKDQTKVYPKRYPGGYHLITQTNKSYVNAYVYSTPSVGSVLSFGLIQDKPDWGKTGSNHPGRFPGKVGSIQLISRTMERHEGAVSK